MGSDFVLDASVFAAATYQETTTLAAQERLRLRQRFIAPDLIFAELTHVGAKKIRRGEASAEEAASALDRLSFLLFEVAPSCRLAPRAVHLATQIGATGYDAIYVALAEARGVLLLTADGKLAVKMRDAGMGAMVDLVQP